MTYDETIAWMFKQLPMYQTQGASAYKSDLDNIIAFAKHLKNPEHNLKTIHIAGTNGKGSTSSLLASVLQEAGYNVGLYTSPHLKDYRERIRINGKKITKKYVTNFITENKNFLEQYNLSFFEMSVGLAFSYFRGKKVDVAIIEVGMGGRLDATNIITPLLSVITNIGLDHTQFLGDTLELIAAEKAGIIKKNVPVVIGEYTAETKPVFITKAKENNVALHFASDLIAKTYPSALQGHYQEKNIKTVLQSIAVLKKYFIITDKDCQKGFLNVVKNTKLIGRWQQISDLPKIICDTAHNYDGLQLVLSQIKTEKYKKLHIVLGFVSDKKLHEILILFPKDAAYYFCKPNNKRGFDAEILEEQAHNYGLTGNSYNSVAEAFTSAKSQADADDFIYVGGSTFVVAEIL